MAFHLRDILRVLSGPEKKKSPFSSEKEAFDFCRSLYRETGGATPELLRAYEFYQKNMTDGCDNEPGYTKADHLAHSN
ncbi:MAG: hypothetical protein IE937_10460 [Gammaproteobacteria bacterium]|nr:hypothetical protein [Gammaproteobacteria bacterium]